jgi:hypothetical protein
MKLFRFAGIPLAAVGGLMLITGLSAGVSAQNVYKTVDDFGNVEYTDRPPMGSDMRPVEQVKGLDILWSDEGLIEAKNITASEKASKQQQAKQESNQKAAEAAVEQQASEQERAANCKSSKTRLTKYNQEHRIYRQTDNGGREYLTSAELETLRADTASSVKEWCS